MSEVSRPAKTITAEQGQYPAGAPIGACSGDLQPKPPCKYSRVTPLSPPSGANSCLSRFGFHGQPFKVIGG
jgi:hypothetical protein